MVRVNYDGRLGNNLFQYALGRLLAERFCYALQAPVIPGFPVTTKQVPGRSIEDPISVLKGQKIDIDRIDSLRNKSGLFLRGFFQRYEYYQRDVQKIRWWFNQGWYPVEIHPDDIVVHVRRTQPSFLDTTWVYSIVGDNVVTENDVFPLTERTREVFRSGSLRASRDILPFEFYEKLLDRMSFRKIQICTDVPQDPYFRHFKKYDHEIRRTSVMDDFNFMRSSKRLIISISTMSWWAALLSNAGEIYCPQPLYGTWHTPITGVNLKVTDDSRYRVIDVKREGSFF